MSLANFLLILVLLPIAIAIVAVPALRGSLGRVLRQRAFLGAVIVLGVAAVGLNAATEAMRLQFRKEAVPLAVPRLDDEKLGIPARLGHWVQVTKDEPLDPQVQEVLGTKEFVFRDYVDSRLVSREDIEWFATQPKMERPAPAHGPPGQAAGGGREARRHLLHGLVDTVPHVPEKCYLADGFDMASDPETVPATVGTLADGTTPRRTCRTASSASRTRRARARRQRRGVPVPRERAYESSNVGVRAELANLFQRYGYFAKVELMTAAPSTAGGTAADRAATREQSLKAINDLLASALPEVERCLPDWKQVTAGSAPVPAVAAAAAAVKP
jgi:hypothetical protein